MFSAVPVWSLPGAAWYVSDFAAAIKDRSCGAFCMLRFVQSLVKFGYQEANLTTKLVLLA